MLRPTLILGTPPCSPKSPPPCLSPPLSHSLGLARRKAVSSLARLSPTVLTQSQLPPPLPTILHGLLSLRSKVMSSQQPPGPAGSLLSVLPPPPPIPLPLSPFFLSLLPFLPSLLSSLPPLPQALASRQLLQHKSPCSGPLHTGCVLCPSLHTVGALSTGLACESLRGQGLTDSSQALASPGLPLLPPCFSPWPPEIAWS